MNYTQAQIDRANAVSLEDFLHTQGETLIKSGREYINKLCTRTLYDPDGQPHVRVDEYMKRRLEIKLIHSIVSMS